MQITPIGAARTVTGSSYLIENGDGDCFLVDCGMFQGGRRMEERNWLTENYRPTELKGILITHAHIDHSGLIVSKSSWRSTEARSTARSAEVWRDTSSRPLAPTTAIWGPGGCSAARTIGRTCANR